ncbi:MAG: zinc ribbon domain-containing protein [Kiritimatiellia bacterium]
MSTIESLLALQEVDSRIRDLQREIDHASSNTGTELRRLAEARQNVQAVERALLAARTRVASLEAEIVEHEETIRRRKEAQNDLVTNREFQALNEDIDRIREQISQAQARLTVANDDIIPLQTDLAQANEALKEAEAIAGDHEREMAERLDRVREELTRSQAERDEAVKTVDPTYLAYYERLKTSRWPIVVRMNVQAGVCSGCNLIQTPATRQSVLRGRELVVCESCGRILYKA